MSIAKSFAKDGITSIRLYTPIEVLTLRKFLHAWISSNFISQGVNTPLPANLAKYHNWASVNQIPHESLFRAPFRFCNPPREIESLLINTNLKNVFQELGLEGPSLIDEGMGWLGYRIIRPGMGDGYPMSCKNWGASKGAFSIWLPLYSFSSKYSLKHVEKSHLNTYKNYLPSEGKFTKDELRLDLTENVDISSRFVLPGNALFYHPKTLHSENVESGSRTRLNLEFRFLFENREG